MLLVVGGAARERTVRYFLRRDGRRDRLATLLRFQLFTQCNSSLSDAFADFSPRRYLVKHGAEAMVRVLIDIEYVPHFGTLVTAL